MGAFDPLVFTGAALLACAILYWRSSAERSLVSGITTSPRSRNIDSKNERRALILVDVQNDFMPGGALAVPDGDQVVTVCNLLRKQCPWRSVILTQDWHPKDHVSFASNNGNVPLFSLKKLELGDQVMWPDHCVAGSSGAAFHADLERSVEDVVVRKGTVRIVDSYSGFGDAFQGKFEKTELADKLRAQGIDSVVIAGLATDYCVAATAKDAAREGFQTTLVLDGCRGISANTIEEEMAAMKDAGVRIVQSIEDL